MGLASNRLNYKIIKIFKVTATDTINKVNAFKFKNLGDIYQNHIRRRPNFVRCEKCLKKNLIKLQKEHNKREQIKYEQSFHKRRNKNDPQIKEVKFNLTK